MTRVIFMGTPDFAVSSLEALVEAPDFEVVGVVTQPDRPAGRGRKLKASPVNECASIYGIPVYQPEKLRGDEAVEPLRAWEPDVIVVAAFGQILRANVLDLPEYGCINIHASLLPRWRGAAPIQYAIRAGDAETGVTIMQMDPGLDTGPMLLGEATLIAPDETGATLHDKLAALGAKLILPALRGYISGEITPQPQPEEGVTIARSIRKAAGRIDWREGADAIDRQVRAYDPWPGTFTIVEGERMKILAGEALMDAETDAEPGTFVALGDGFGVAAGEGVYRVTEIQPAGKKRMPAEAFLAGRGDVIGMRAEVENCC